MGAGSLWQRSGEELLRDVAELEMRMRRDYAMSLELVRELEVRDVVSEVGYPNLAVLLRDVLRVSVREASRRIRQANAVTQAPAISGGMLPAVLPLTAAAVREGALGPEHIDVISAALRDLPLDVPDADREFAEATLVDAGREVDAGRLTRVGHRVRAWLCEDDQPPSDRELRDPVNELHLTPRSNGSTAFRGELDREGSAVLLAVLSPLAKPRPSSDIGPDPRTAAERQGDALAEVLRLAADTGHLPTEAGERPHLLVTVPLRAPQSHLGRAVMENASLHRLSRTILKDVDSTSLHRPGHTIPRDVDSAALYRLGSTIPEDVGGTGLDGDGYVSLDGPDRAVLDRVGHLDAATARRLACDARVIPVILGGRSEPLDLGRASYVVSTAIRRALVLRDGGCAFPACNRRYRWCHAHHVRHWADGGSTDLGNLVLLCGQHHRLIHSSEWDCAIVDGRPQFRPPRFLDANRSPRRQYHHHGTSMSISRQHSPIDMPIGAGWD